MTSAKSTWRESLFSLNPEKDYRKVETSLKVCRTPTAQIWHLVASAFFPKLKPPLKGKRFQTIDEIQEKYNWAAYSDWENCVKSLGAYFEGD